MSKNETIRHTTPCVAEEPARATHRMSREELREVLLAAPGEREEESASTRRLAGSEERVVIQRLVASSREEREASGGSGDVDAREAREEEDDTKEIEKVSPTAQQATHALSRSDLDFVVELAKTRGALPPRARAAQPAPPRPRDPTWPYAVAALFMIATTALLLGVML